MTWRSAGAVVLAALAGAVPAAQPRGVSYTFDTDAAGKPPASFAFSAFRQDAPGVWSVARRGSSGTLTHVATPSRTGWSLAIAQGSPIADVLVSVRVRLAGGARAGGIVWRYQNPENFDAVLLDLTRHEITGYRVVAGSRIQYETEDDLELDPDAWHTLKVVQNGPEVSASLGGIRVFEERYRRDTRPREGLAGVVATGHSEVWFDDLRIEPRQSGNARPAR